MGVRRGRARALPPSTEGARRAKMAAVELEKAGEKKPSMTQEVPNNAGSSQPAEPRSSLHKEEGGFPASRVHAVLAFLATRRWPRFLGYGMLIVACRVVRTIIRA